MPDSSKFTRHPDVRYRLIIGVHSQLHCPPSPNDGQLSGFCPAGHPQYLLTRSASATSGGAGLAKERVVNTTAMVIDRTEVFISVAWADADGLVEICMKDGKVEEP